MMNRNKYIPVTHISLQGRMIIRLLRLLFTFRRLLGGKDWNTIRPEHHEDPLRMKLKDHVYFAHKYYYRALTGSGENLPDFHASMRTFTKTSDKTLLSISIGGDLMPYASINEKVCKHLWSECGDFFFDADIVTANLETPMMLSRKPSLVPELMLKNMYFNASDEIFHVFSGNGKYKGYDVLSIANNHSLDQGVEGLKATMQFLDKKGIVWCGASREAETILEVPIVERQGIKVAFIGATFSLNARQLPPDNAWLLNHIDLNSPNPDLQILAMQAAKARNAGADLIIAHMHMGCAYQTFPSAHTVQNMRAIAACTGADVIVGAHPHNIQPLERIVVVDPFTGKEKESLIIYSLGDFVAYDIFKWCHTPLMLKLHFSKDIDGVKLQNLEIRQGYMDASKANGRIKQLILRFANPYLFTDAKAASWFQPEAWEEIKPFVQFQLGGVSHLV
jgi:hypothetical protein